MDIKQFRYKGKRYAMSELDIDTSVFEGCCAQKDGIIVCVINHNLSFMGKQNVLHRLIKGKKLRICRRIV